MADDTINASTGPDPQFGGTNCGPFWKTDQVGYRLFIDSNKKVQYSKSSAPGTWAAGVSALNTGESTNGYVKFSGWFDQETTGDSGTKVHIVGEDQNSTRIRYRNLDVSSDTLGTEVTVATVSGHLQGGGYPDKNWLEAGMCPITKTRGGNLYTVFRDVSAGPTCTWRHCRSTDGGANWTSRNAGFGLTTNPFDNQIYLLPANDTDSNDLAAILLQDNFPTATATLSVVLYDDSADTWGTPTTIATLSSDGGDWADYIWASDAAIRHSDGKAIIAAWQHSDYASPATNELKVWELTLTAAGLAATAKTSVITGAANAQECGVFIDQATGDVYVAYVKGGTWYSSVDVYFKKSSDGCSTWGTETKLNTTAHNIGHVDTGHSVKSGQSGRFQPSWADIGNLDILTNSGTSVAITVAGAAPGRFFFGMAAAQAA